MKSLKISLMILWGFIFSTYQTIAQNLLTDGGFNTTISITPYYTGAEPLNTWCSWRTDGTNVTTEVTAGVCKYSILNAGSQSWEVQLIQWGFPLELGYAYQLSFDVKADAERSFGIYIGENGGAWANLNKNYTQTATTAWQTKTISFNATSVSALQKLSFEMGGGAINMYFDNIVLVKTGLIPKPKIDMIGSAAPPYDWSVGVEMGTTDGENYSLTNFTVKAGELKFRQDQDWAINWGGSSFPMGTATQNGPNIPVMAGTYDINFNWKTGEYAFTCPSCPPAIGIIGSSVPPYDWSKDVKMTTSDGIIYTLKDFELKYGALKFRQNSDWTFNWGGADFPSGTATLNGPNIPVPQGRYDIQFNRITGAYTFATNIPPIGILGSALNGWDVDIDMESADGIDYVLKNQQFTAGEVKFRQDNSWNINWGNNTFPWGSAFQNGPNIPVPQGVYNVYFNRLYGYYSFQLVCPDPVLICPPDIDTVAAYGQCGVVVYFKMPTPADNCGYPYVYQVGGQPSGSFFPVGKWTQTFMMMNNTGKTTSCSFNITVKDEAPPTITNVSTTTTRLWPANHNMAEVKVYYNAWDDCGNVNTTIAVSSNEPVNGTGDGDMSPDWNIIDNHIVQLRAERSGNGKGRIYTIVITATDLAGNTTTKNAEVLVPHDASGTNAKAADIVALPPYAGSELNATISPNPSFQSFTLYLGSGSNENAGIRLFDMNGRVMGSINAGNNKSIRFGNDLKPGVYMVEITQGAQRIFRKIVKQ